MVMMMMIYINIHFFVVNYGQLLRGYERGFGKVLHHVKLGAKQTSEKN